MKNTVISICIPGQPASLEKLRITKISTENTNRSAEIKQFVNADNQIEDQMPLHSIKIVHLFTIFRACINLKITRDRISTNPCAPMLSINAF